MRGFPGEPDQLRACARRRSNPASLGPGCQVAARTLPRRGPVLLTFGPRASPLLSVPQPRGSLAHTAGPSAEPQPGSLEALAS